MEPKQLETHEKLSLFAVIYQAKGYEYPIDLIISDYKKALAALSE